MNIWKSVDYAVVWTTVGGTYHRNKGYWQNYFMVRKWSTLLWNILKLAVLILLSFYSFAGGGGGIFFLVFTICPILQAKIRFIAESNALLWTAGGFACSILKYQIRLFWFAESLQLWNLFCLTLFWGQAFTAFLQI